MLAKGKTRILNSGDWWTASNIYTLAQLDPVTFALELREWTLQGKIFALNNDGLEYFPIYGFDPSAGYSPLPSLAEIISLLAPKKSGWGIAFWLGSSNSYLAGHMPKDVFKHDLKSVLEAAKNEMSEFPS